MISDELALRYVGTTIQNDYMASEKEFYKIFLERTDFIVSKMSEDYITGQTKTQKKEKYGDIIAAREFARGKINEAL